MRFLPALLLLAATTLLPAHAQPDGAVKWAFNTMSSSAVGGILSSPALAADGTIYFGVQAGTAQRASGMVVAVAPSGALKWFFSTPDWVDSSPAVGADGTVYVGCWDGKLYALAPNGAKKWDYATGTYIVSSPAVSGDGTIYVGAGDFGLHALRPDGSLKWQYPTADWVDGTPSIGADGMIYVGAGRTLYAVRPDGVGQWQAVLTGGMVGAPAIAADGTIYAAARDKRLYAFASGGALRWHFETGDAIDASPVLGADGTIYLGSLDGRFYAVAPDGSERWRFPRANQPALAPLYSTAAVRADGSLVFGSSDHAIYALHADGTLRWKTAIGDWADASPVIAPDGTIYVGSYDKRLYALHGTSAPADTDWPMFKGSPSRTSWQWRGLGGGRGRLLNASAHGLATGAADTLTASFTVAGEGEQPLLLRGVGPVLKQFGVLDAIDAPELQVFARGAASPLLTNTGWSTAPNAAAIAAHAASLGAAPLPEAGRDTAAFHAFAAGEFIASVRSLDESEGTAIFELFDAGNESTRLTAFTARSQVAAGARALIAGFVVSGGQRTLLIRGVGTALASSPALHDPNLQLYAGGLLAAQNNDARDASNTSALAAATRALGLAPLPPDNRAAALLVRVGPGIYTVQLTPADAGSGLAEIEVHELP